MANVFVSRFGVAVVGVAAVALVALSAAPEASATTIGLTGVLGGDLSIIGYDSFGVDATGNPGGPFVLQDQVSGTETTLSSGNAFKGLYVFSTSAALPVTSFDINVSNADTSYLSGYKVFDISTHTLLTSASNLTASVDDVLIPALSLTGGDTYGLKLYFVIGQGDAGATFNGTVSAVPLPGGLALFGTALIGIAGLARRRQKNKGAVVTAKTLKISGALMAALAVIGFGLPKSAKAATLFPDYKGVVDLNGGSPLPAGATSLSFMGLVTSSAAAAGTNGATSGGYNGAATLKAKETTFGTSLTAASSFTQLNFEFELSKPSNVNLTITDSKGDIHSLDSFALTGGTSTETSPVYKNNSVTVSFDGLKANTLYDLIVTASNDTVTRALSISGTVVVSPVPVPSALLLFSSGIVGLGAIASSRGRRKKSV